MSSHHQHGPFRPGDPYASQPVSIGARYLQKPDAWGNFFDGRIDDVRIYDRVLSPDEVAALAGK